MKKITKTFVQFVSICLIVGSASTITLSAARSNSHAASPSAKNTTSAATVSPSPSATADVDLDGKAKDWKNALSEAKKAAKTEEKLARYKALAEILVNNRIGILENLKTRLQATTNAADQNQAETIAKIDKDIAGLQALLTKIKAETDLEAIKAEIRQIFTDFWVYRVETPQMLGEKSVAQGQYILGRLNAIQAQVQNLIDKAKVQGKDTSSVDALLVSLNAKLDDAKVQLDIAETKFKAMNPANTEQAKTLRDEGKAAMKAAKQDLKDAHDILKEMIAKLKVINPSPTLSATPASSASPIASPSPSASPASSPTPSPIES